MDSVVDRVSRSIAQRGYAGTLRLCLVTLGWSIFPRFRRTEARRRQADAEFDRRYGVDTGGIFRPRSDNVVGTNWAYGGSYQAVDGASFLHVLAHLRIPFEEFAFVDFGSGKGRTLLLASLFPFKRVIGVEYCRELNEIARKNVERFSPVEQRCRQLEVVDADAAEFQVPQEPLVVFLFHPFAEPVMSKVVSNLAASYHQHRRRIVVIYFFPNHARLWESTGIFERLEGTPAIFDTQPARARRRRELVAAAQAFYLVALQALSDCGSSLTF